MRKPKTLTIEETIGWLHVGLAHNANTGAFTERISAIFSKEELAAIVIALMQRRNRIENRLREFEANMMEVRKALQIAAAELKKGLQV